MKRIMAVALGCLMCAPVWAGSKDHSSEYQVGIFQSTDVTSDGSYASCNGGGCSGYNAGHNTHFITTNDGVFIVQAPVSTGASILMSMATNGNAPAVHIQWFMDDLHQGDKVLFAAKCNKHNDCTFWLPKPDQPGKEYITQGYFRPLVAKTNTTQLCGTGKLSPAVEAEVCKATVPTPTPKQ